MLKLTLLTLFAGILLMDSGGGGSHEEEEMVLREKEEEERGLEYLDQEESDGEQQQHPSPGNLGEEEHMDTEDVLVLSPATSETQRLHDAQEYVEEQLQQQQLQQLDQVYVV